MAISCHQNRVPVLGLGCIQFQTSQVDAKTMACSLQTDSGAPLLRTTLPQSLKHAEVEQVPNWSLYTYILDSLVWEGTLAGYPKISLLLFIPS